MSSFTIGSSSVSDTIVDALVNILTDWGRRSTEDALQRLKNMSASEADAELKQVSGHEDLSHDEIEEALDLRWDLIQEQIENELRKEQSSHDYVNPEGRERSPQHPHDPKTVG